jgi:nitrous oxidase accessory protein NosD
MTSTFLPLRALLLFSLSLMAVMRAAPLYAATDVRGTWSGTFSSNHSGVAPFTITVVIDADSNGHLVGTSTLNSRCLKGAQLQVTVTGSTVVLAGSDKTGNNMTLRGSLDDTGTLLKSAYIFNGSAGGGCETDDGTGTLTKR